MALTIRRSKILPKNYIAVTQCVQYTHSLSLSQVVIILGEIRLGTAVAWLVRLASPSAWLRRECCRQHSRAIGPLGYQTVA
jgi:hypothetical protein